MGGGGRSLIEADPGASEGGELCVLKDTSPIIYNFNSLVTAEDRPDE